MAEEETGTKQTDRQKQSHRKTEIETQCSGRGSNRNETDGQTETETQRNTEIETQCCGRGSNRNETDGQTETEKETL